MAQVWLGLNCKTLTFVSVQLKTTDPFCFCGFACQLQCPISEQEGQEERRKSIWNLAAWKKNPNVYNQLESSVDLRNRLGLTGYWLLIKQYLALSDEQQWRKVWAPCQTRAIEDGWWVKCGGLSGSVGARSSRRTCQLLVRLVKGRTPAPDGWGSIDAS